MSEPSKAVVVVVGSLHYDIMVDAPDRPRKGETVAGYGWRPKFGGKGGNQAVASSKAGSRVRMVGAVGNDDFGRFLVDRLASFGIDASRVRRVAEVGSGMSVAISDNAGDYGAVIVSGANLRIEPSLVTEKELWLDAKVLILQNEVPEPLNILAASAARAAGAIVCLNAAPYRPMSDEFLALIDVLVVNAIEAEQLASIAVADLASARNVADHLLQRFPSVVVTAGADGVAGGQKGAIAIGLPASPVELVSTHGAGDVFVGALASAIAGGKSFSHCLASANEAAAIHVSTREG